MRVRKGLPLPGHPAQADFPQGFECLAAQGGNGREREKVFRGECDRDVAGFELRTAEFGQGLFQAGFLGRCRLLPYQAVGVECVMLLSLRLDGARVGREDYGTLLVALSPNRLSDGGGYSALIGT